MTQKYNKYYIFQIIINYKIILARSLLELRV